MLTSKMTQTIEIPGEPGQTVTIRKLSHHQLMMAEDAKRDAALGLMKSLAGVTLPESTPEQQAAAGDPLNKYARDVVLTAGTVAWTYAEPCDAEHLADIDEDMAAWLFGEILRFSIRSADEGEASASV